MRNVSVSTYYFAIDGVIVCILLFLFTCILRNLGWEFHVDAIVFSSSSSTFQTQI